MRFQHICNVLLLLQVPQPNKHLLYTKKTSRKEKERKEKGKIYTQHRTQEQKQAQKQYPTNKQTSPERRYWHLFYDNDNDIRVPRRGQKGST